VRRGRTAVEAAGEVRWLVESFQIEGATSRATTDEAIAVIESWLAETMGEPPEKGGIHFLGAKAEMYAQFLAKKVTIQRLDPPPQDQIDSAWKEWRKQGKS